jgi:GNAT superfamily N-acetyltransferase
MYFLHFLCTSDAARGKGVAHALLSPLLEMVGGDGVEIGLITHTEQNVSLIEGVFTLMF